MSTLPNYNPSCIEFTVDPEVISFEVAAYGASGSNAEQTSPDPCFAPGGLGGYIWVSIQNQAPYKYYALPGAAGQALPCYSTSACTAGFAPSGYLSGGGSGSIDGGSGGSGGGSTDIRTNLQDLSTRLVVAGGGGGAGTVSGTSFCSPGGFGGGLIGGDGGSADASYQGSSATGGSQTSGGAGGTDADCGQPGNAISATGGNGCNYGAGGGTVNQFNYYQ